MSSEKTSQRRVILGSDHAGFELKQSLLQALRAHGYQVQDVGTNSPRPVDYPDQAEAVASRVVHQPGSRGILICGSGVGASVAANKIPGVRAGLCHDCYSARQGVEHDDMNVLVVGARVIGARLAEDLALIFLRASFSSELRHLRRLKKIRKLEAKYERIA